MVVVVVEEVAFVISVPGVVAGMMEFGMAMNQNFVMAINFRLVNVLCR